MIERLKKYDNEIYTIPYWQGNTIYHETLVFVKNGTDNPRAKLLFNPTEIISFRSSSLENEFELEKDYLIDGNEIILTDNTSIPIIQEDELYTEEENFPSKSSEKYYNYFGGGSLWVRTVSVTYKHNGKWTGHIPEYCGDKLPFVTNKIKNKQSLKIAFIGDSITALGDISGSQNCKPYMPRYSEILVERIKTLTGASIEYKNLAIGGTYSTRYLEDEAMQSEVHNFSPDLVFIAYGMNDGCWANAETFTQNISKIIDNIKAHQPTAEFILISTVLPNKDACWKNRNLLFRFQNDYESEMLKLETKGICVARITSIYNYLEENKGFLSLSATGFNHPNDFTVRTYAQAILQMLGF